MKVTLVFLAALCACALASVPYYGTVSGARAVANGYGSRLVAAGPGNLYGGYGAGYGAGYGNGLAYGPGYGNGYYGNYGNNYGPRGYGTGYRNYGY